MKLLRRLSAFALTFGLLSWTVAAMSAAVFSDTSDGSEELAAVAASDTQTEFKPRLSAPSYSNPYYYSDKNVFYEYGWGMPNCTCYAWGRAYELLGSEPNLCLYSAHLWYDYNIQYGYYPYGSEPKLGAIACWKYSSGNSGHVAVVEKIENGKITFSNSAYSGTEFYLDTVPIDDPSDGRKTWIFQGYIYIGDFAAPDALAADEPVEGQLYRITSDDGVNVRSAAGTGNAVIGLLLYDDRVYVTRTTVAGGYSWGCIDYDGMSGWIAIDFAEPIGADEPNTGPEPTEAEEPPVIDEPTENIEPADDDEVLSQLPSPTAVLDDLIMGDLDSDGSVTILDATRIQRILVRLVEPDDYMLAVGDYDGDGSLTILDANRIQCFLINRL